MTIIINHIRELISKPQIHSQPPIRFFTNTGFLGGGESFFFFWFSCEDTLDIVTDFHQRWWTLFLSGGSGTVLQPTRTYDYWSICITATRQLPRHDPSLERTRPSRSLRLGLWKINFVFVFLPVSRWVDWRYLSTMPWLLCICLGME